MREPFDPATDDPERVRQQRKKSLEQLELPFSESARPHPREEDISDLGERHGPEQA